MIPLSKFILEFPAETPQSRRISRSFFSPAGGILRRINYRAVFLKEVPVKSIILVLAILMSAQSSFGASCIETYKTTAGEKMRFRKDVAKQALDNAQGLSTFTAGFTIGAAFNPAILPVAVGSASAEATFYLIGIAFGLSSLNIKEQRALEYNDMAAKSYGFVRRILIKARKKNLNTTMADVTSIIARGFESGDFCANPDRLFGPRNIRKYVLERI